MAKDTPTSDARHGVQGFLYDANGHDQAVTLDADPLDRLGPGALLWLDLEGRAGEDVARIAAALRLEPASAAALGRPDDPPGGRVDNFGRYLQFSVALPGAARPDAADAETLQSPEPHARPRLDFLVGDNWLLTAHDAPVGFLDAFRGQDKAETAIGALSAHALAASLLDWHLETVFTEVGRLELAVDRLDERILAEPDGDTLLERVLAIRRRISRLRRLLSAQRPVFYGLTRPDVLPTADPVTTRLFEVLAQRYERAVDEVEHTRDLVVGSFELFTSRSSQETNELVKVLTFFTVIIGSAAAVAGLFGMNFDPPFFKSGSMGFFAVAAGLCALALAAWIVGKRRRWI